MEDDFGPYSGLRVYPRTLSSRRDLNHFSHFSQHSRAGLICFAPFGAGLSQNLFPQILPKELSRQKLSYAPIRHLLPPRCYNSRREVLAVKEGKIISGYVRMWPRGVFSRSETEKQMLSRSLEFLKGPGVYILYRNETPYYIGQATRLHQRLWGHARRPQRRYFHFWNFFSAFAVEEKGLRNELEGILIASMPTANSAKPKLEHEPMPSSVSKMLLAEYDHG